MDMTNNIHIQYDLRKKSILQLIGGFNIFLYLLVLLTHNITNNYIYLFAYLIFLAVQSVFLFYSKELLIFEHRFLKFYETVLHERQKSGDSDYLKNPRIWIQFNGGQYKIKFDELGYFRYEDYEEIGRRVERFCEAEFAGMHKEFNFQVLNFEKKRSRLVLNDKLDFPNELIKEGTIQLDSRLRWNYFSHPHAIITGSTGSGKSYCLNYIMEELLSQGCGVWLFDPKYEYDPTKNMVKTFNSIEEILSNLKFANEQMEHRKIHKPEEMRPVFLVFEELAALKAVMTSEQKKEFESIFNNILFTGRSTKINIIVVSQSVSAKLFTDSETRNQFHCKIHLGQISREKSEMLFGISRNKLPEKENVIGAGFVELEEHVYSYISPTSQ